jgi:hypothetical protein
VSAIAIVSPGFPDDPGGVTDHTERLVAHWQEAGNTVHTLGAPTAGPDAQVALWHASGVTGVLLQYVPFLYGRLGISRVPEQVARAAHARGLRVTTFVHEPWVPPTRAPWLILSPLQRRQLRRLVASSDCTVTAVPAWAEQLGPQTQVVRVGSTLGEPPAETTPGPPLPAPVVFSPFAAGLAWDWIAAAVAAIAAEPPLIVIGATAEELRRHHVVRRWHQPQWDCRGRLPGGEALGLLARARVVLAPFVDGLTGRRTSAMASLSAGATMVSSSGPLFDPLFEEGPIEIAGSREVFVQRAADAWQRPISGAERERRLAWYRGYLDPRELDSHLLSLVLP